MFQEGNRWNIIQHLLSQDIIIKRKPLLDHFSSGLEILGFDNAVQSDPETFRDLFVLNSSLNAQTVMQSIEFEETEFVNVHRYFEQYILSSNKATLKSFLTFVTGSPVLPKFGFSKIKVEVEKNTSSISSSTYLNSLSVPAAFANQEQFNESLNAVITEKTFNSIQQHLFLLHSYMQKLVLSLESNDISPSFTVLILSKCVNVETYVWFREILYYLVIVVLQRKVLCMILDKLLFSRDQVLC